MTFLVRTDKHIRNSAEFNDSIRTTVEGKLSLRFGDRLRRVEVYLEDVNGVKGGMDTRCSIEVHLAGRPPVAAHGLAANAETAVEGAVEKVLHLLDHQLGRQEDRAGHQSAGGEERV